MIPRRHGQRVQKGNPHRLTREQHVIPRATLRRFASNNGKVEVHLRDGRIATLPIDHQLFCVERLWDQRAETGYMKKIEDQFQEIIDRLEAGQLLPLSPGDHRQITRFWALWQWRNHFIDQPLEDARLNGLAGEDLSLDKQELLESRWYAFTTNGAILPARMMTGLQIQMAIDHAEAADTRRWGVLRSPHLPLLIGDRPGSVLSIPASPRILLAVDNPDGELTLHEAFQANRAALMVSRNYVIVGR